MKQNVIVFLVMSSYSISWSMNKNDGWWREESWECEYVREDEKNKFFNSFGAEEIKVILYYSVYFSKKHAERGVVLFKVHYKNSYPSGAISNRSFEWEEPGNRHFPDLHNQSDTINRKLSRTKRKDDHEALIMVQHKILRPRTLSYISREDIVEEVREGHS